MVSKNNIIFIGIGIIFFIVIAISYYKIVIPIQNNKLQNFLFKVCEKGTCYSGLKKCSSTDAYVYVDNNEEKIERKTYKCIFDTVDKYKLFELKDIFVPSMMDGTYCDVLYTTYYDYNDLTILRNRINSDNLPLTKCIRIRSYLFNPNTYFEIKYPGGIKIRVLIDDKYNMLEPEKLDAEYKETITDLLNKIKNDTIKPIFHNIYKRLSFIYKHNPKIRMTLDSNVEFFQNNIYKALDKDILEIKVPMKTSTGEVTEYIKEINELANTELVLEHFSKFEYYYYNVIMKQNE